MTDMDGQSGNGSKPYGNDPGAGMCPFYGSVVPILWPYVERDQLQSQIDSQFGETRSTRELARNTTPCWHFVKNGGKCSRGPSCAFVHDMEWYKVLERDREEERKVTGTEKVSHCWAYAQGRCRKSDCTYLHPQDIGPYIPYTPCANWSSCSRAPYCPFQHPVRPSFGESQSEMTMQNHYIGQLATMRGKPITFNGTTFFPTMDGSIDDEMESSVQHGRETRTSVHAHRSRTASESCTGTRDRKLN